MRVVGVLLLCLAWSGCGESRRASLAHEAYVWQRDWNGPVAQAVVHAPTEIGGLRVLALEVARNGAGRVRPAVDLAALARSRRRVIAVVRIDGSRPLAALSLAPLYARLEAWRAAGIRLVGVEVDHDCGTANLADYAAWLVRQRPPAPLRWSITALPTWSGSRALPLVADAVDELVVQVHAVRAPRLFEAAEARRWLQRFATAIHGKTLRVALPTYRVMVAGRQLAADPVEIAGFVRQLRRAPVSGLAGVVWFRLPVATDSTAWSAATLAAVIRGDDVKPRVNVRLEQRAPGMFDVVLENLGNADRAWPGITLGGHIAGADLVGGYRVSRDRGWRAPGRMISPGHRAVVGWVRGKELYVETW